MAYDDLKEFEGEEYSGMRVGGSHTWHYTDALWREGKISPDAWAFTLTSVKKRDQSAPPGSGAAVFTEYHWYLLAHQWVRKIDADSYTTFMSGLKYKVAHRRPHWQRWSNEYPGNDSERERIVEILSRTLNRLQTGDEAPLAFASVER